MATRGMSVVGVPANLFTGVSPNMVDGSSYTIQNVGVGMIYYAIAATAPTSAAVWHVLPFGAVVGITVDLAEPIWVRSSGGDDAFVIAVTEAS